MKKILIIFTISIFILSCTEDKKKQPEQVSSQVRTLLNQADKFEPSSSEFYSFSDSAYQIAKQESSSIGQAKALKNFGDYYNSKNNFKQAREKYQTAIEVLKDTLYQKEVGELQHKLGDVLYEQNRLSESFKAYKKAAENSKAAGDSVGLGNTYNNIGYNYWDIAKYDSAIIFFRRALQIRENLPNKRAYASTLNNIGTVYYQWSIYDKALKYYTESLRIRKEIDDTPGVALVSSNLGQVYEELDSLSAADKYYEESLKFAKESKDTQTIAYALNSKASIFERTDPDSALRYYKRSLNYYQKAGFIQGVLLSLTDIANFYLNNNKYDSAKRYLSQMLAKARQNRVDLKIAEAYKIYGDLHNKRGDNSTAISFYNRAIQKSKEIDNKLFLKESYLALSDIYKGKNNSQKAFDYYLSYLDYKDALNNEDMERRISDLENKFQVENFERKIEAQNFANEKQRIVILYTAGAVVVLIGVAVGFYLIARKRKTLNNLLQEKSDQVEKQRTELSEKNKELVELNKTKDRFFSIVAHDLKNPFVTLTGYSGILREEFNELSSQEKLQYINEIENTTQKTQVLLENLLDWSASQTGKIEREPANMNLKELVDSVTGVLESQAKNKNIKIINRLDDSDRAYGDWHMIEVVVRNLLTNAIKFSESNSTIEVNGDENAKNKIISVRDFGMGMDEESRQQLFNINNNSSQKGTKGEKGTGLGLTICKEFVEKNKGELWAESKLGEGSIFYFTLPHAIARN